jgi:UDP-N-acetylmuramoyl-L-alanyl-D-glutamate--2,6-diaminopimelate ligase
VHIAKSTDVILVAGKGHETYQDIKGVKHHFDDREIIKELFKL